MKNIESKLETKIILILKDKDNNDGSLYKRINELLNLNEKENQINLVSVKYPYISLKIKDIENKLLDFKFIEILKTFSTFNILLKNQEYEVSLIKELIQQISQFLLYENSIVI